jgi:hypothetical protein
MMTDSLIDRIKEKGQQANNLLSPWLRSNTSQNSEQDVHMPVGKRHVLAARKMRVLDDQKLGIAHPENLRALGANFIEKLSSIQSMVHFSPNITRDPSIWSQVDRVYPTSTAEAPRQPDQPGVMRAGSIIQKFSMTPKPGQSIESFKEQASRTNKPKTASPRPQKPSLPSKARLFSRVQEINPNVKNPEPRLGDVDSPMPLSPLPEKSTHAPADRAPDLIQPELPKEMGLQEEKPQIPVPEQALKPAQSDPASQIQQERPEHPSPADLSSDLPLHAPLLENQTEPEAPARAEIIDETPSAPKVEASPVSAQEKTQAKLSEEKPVEPLPQAQPVKKQDDKQAARVFKAAPFQSPLRSDQPPSKPVSRPSQTVQRQLDRPSASPSLPPAEKGAPVQPSSDQAAISSPRKPPENTSERLPKASLISGEEPLQAEPETPLRVLSNPPTAAPSAENPPQDSFDPPLAAAPSINSITQGILAPPLAAAVSTESLSHDPFDSPPAAPPNIPAPVEPVQPPVAPPSLTLHHRLIERKASVQALKPATSKILRQPQAKPLVQPQPPLVSTHKYRLETQTAPDAVPPQMSHPSSGPAPVPAVQREVESFQPANQPAFSSQPPAMVLAEPQLRKVKTSQSTPAAVNAPLTVAPQIPVKIEKSSHPKASDAGTAKFSANAAKPQIRPLKSALGGVVQRRWEEHSGPQSASSSSNGGSDQAPEQQSLDLDQLANDILPLVKRLLDIELERSSGGYS